MRVEMTHDQPLQASSLDVILNNAQKIRVEVFIQNPNLTEPLQLA